METVKIIRSKKINEIIETEQKIKECNDLLEYESDLNELIEMERERLAEKLRSLQKENSINSN